MFGLMGSFHCLGMCGPIAIAIPHKSETKAGVVAESLVYNFGRVLTYSLLGVLIGFVGEALSFDKYQETVSIVVGSVLLVSLLIPKKHLSAINGSLVVGKALNRFKNLFRSFLASKSRASLFVLGLLNGLLPCGLVYFALVAAFAQSTVFETAVYMAFFGIGTIPMMAAVYIAKDFMPLNFRKRMVKFIPYGIAVVAVMMILRGMSLGIPYISPVLPDKVVKEAPECCH